MIWFKTWRELRMRLLLALFVISTGIVFEFFQLSQKGEAAQKTAVAIEELSRKAFLIGKPSFVQANAPDFSTQMSWWLYLQLASFMGPVLGVMIAGVGILSRPVNGVCEAVHPSILYTLSLPVPRRRWLFTRTAVGLLSVAGVVILMVSIPPVIGNFVNQNFSWTASLRAAPFLFLGAALFYFFAVLLEAYKGENWRVGSMAALLFCIVIQANFRQRINIFPFMAGVQTSVLETALFMLLSAILFWGAIKMLDRRDF